MGLFLSFAITSNGDDPPSPYFYTKHLFSINKNNNDITAHSNKLLSSYSNVLFKSLYKQ